MTTKKLSDLQSRILSKLPKTRGEVICDMVDYYHPSSVYRAINTLKSRGVISIDEYGVITRAGK